MNARCTTCSARIDFRNQRGAKLKDHRCKCGGSFEIISLHSFPDFGKGGKKIYKNRAGQKFTRDETQNKFLIYEEAK
jgi:hypothetical protein